MRKISWLPIFGIIVLFLVSMTGCVSLERTDKNLVDKPFVYIADFPNKTEDEIYKYCKLWIANTYNSAKSVISYEDPDLKQIRGNGVGSVMPKGDIVSREFRYSISIEVKGTKARLSLSNIQEERYFSGGSSVAGIPNLEYKAHYDAVKDYFDVIGLDFQKNVFPESTTW